MELLGANSGAGLIGVGVGTARQSDGFAVQVSGAAYSSGNADLLRQVKQLMAAFKKKLRKKKKP